jgi:hypothetical protein
MNAWELFAKQRRFDLIYKILFLRNRESPYFRSLYLEHIRAFNNFYERCPVKTKPDDFIDAFLDIDKSVAARGYDDNSVIYTDKDMQIMGSAHRLTVACFRNLDVPVSVQDVSFWAPDYGHFMGLDINRGAADHNALEYVCLNKNAHILQLHSVASRLFEEEVHSIMSRHGFIYYAKNVHLSENGYVNLTLLNYDDDGERGKWVGTPTNGFQGAREKARRCMGENPLRVFVFVCGIEEQAIQAKNEIRALFGLDNDSCHSNDTHLQAVSVAQALFNDNSLRILDQRNCTSDTSKLDKRITLLKKTLMKKNMDMNRVVCVGSSPLNAAGLRVAADLDCLSLDKIPKLLKIYGVSDHEEVMHLYPYDKRDIIENPSLYFWYKGAKFASLEVMLAMKENRKEIPKDIIDCELITHFIDSVCTSASVPVPNILPNSSFLTRAKDVFRAISTKL